MKLYVRQKVFSWGEKFSVYDESGREHYTVRGEVLTLEELNRVSSALSDLR